MKRLLGFSLVIILLGTLLLAACGQASPTTKTTTPPAQTTTTATSPTSTPVQAATYKMTYADFFPPTNWHSILAKLWCEEIKKQTNGQVEITYYPAGQLAKSDQIADAVKTGIADIGMSVTSYTVGRFPGSELIDMPHAYPNGWTATKTAWDFLSTKKPAEWNDYHLLYFHAHGPQVIFSTKKPVRKLEDLKGMVLRSTGMGAKIVEALGAKGYAAGQGDAYELMSKGTIDGSFTPREPLKGWKQAEVVNYVTGTYDIGSSAGFFVAMNKGKWESLPKDIQGKITAISEKWVDSHANAWSAYDQAAIDLFKSMPGKELIALSADEMAKFVAAAKPALDAYMADRSAKGIPVADYEKYITERVAYWSKQAPSDADALAWAEKNIIPFAPK